MSQKNEEFNENENQNENNNLKQTFQQKIGKVLIIFFGCMVAFTVISRITASLTVALVSVESPSRGNLNFQTMGSGKIEGDKEQYIALEDQAKIDKVSVKKGQTVKKGALLFTYDYDDLKDKLETATNELKKDKRDYRKNELTASKDPENLKTTDTDELTVKHAHEDYDSAVDKLKKLQEKYTQKLEKVEKDLGEKKQTDYDAVLKDYNEAQDSYNETNDTKKATYDKAVKDYEAAKRTKKKEEATALGELNDEKLILTNQAKKKTLLMNDFDLLKIYGKAKNTVACEQTFNLICTHYFGEDEFSAVQDKISGYQKKLQEDTSDYDDIKESETYEVTKAKKALDKVCEDDPDFYDVRDTYNKAIYHKKIALKAQERVIDHDKADIAAASPKYAKIQQAVYAYRDELMKGADDSATYSKMYSTVIDKTIIDPESYEKQQNVVAKKQTAYNDVKAAQKILVKDAKDAVDAAKEDWDKSVARSKKKLDLANDAMNRQLAKVYSGDDEMETLKDSIDSQEDEVAKAKRTIEDDKDTLEQTKKDIAKAQKNLDIDAEISKLDNESLKDSIAAKQEKVEELTVLVEAKGKVFASVKGIVTTLDITPKSALSGAEKVAITPDCSSFTGCITKEEVKHVKVEDTVTVKLATSEKEVEAHISQILYNPDEDNYEFTALMPKKNYLPGTTGEFNISNQSEKYEQTVPITAIREDSGAKFVLVMEENKTILGTEQFATKVNVTVLDKDTKTAAIQGSLDSEQKVIVGSNRNVMEGDKVRIGEYE